MNTLFGSVALVSGEAPYPGGELLNGGFFYDYYQTSDNRWLSVGSLEPQFAVGFFSSIGHPEWAARAASQSLDEQAKLREDIQSMIETRTLAEWVNTFAALDVCVEPVLGVLEAAEHPHMQERKMVVDVPVNSDGRIVRQIANPIKFSGSQTHYEKAGGGLGADSKSILQGLGYSDGDINSLFTEGVCG